jgi:hypothetical protein
MNAASKMPFSVGPVEFRDQIVRVHGSRLRRAALEVDDVRVFAHETPLLPSTTDRMRSAKLTI